MCTRICRVCVRIRCAQSLAALSETSRQVPPGRSWIVHLKMRKKNQRHTSSCSHVKVELIVNELEEIIERVYGLTQREVQGRRGARRKAADRRWRKFVVNQLSSGLDTFLPFDRETERRTQFHISHFNDQNIFTAGQLL